MPSRRNNPGKRKGNFSQRLTKTLFIAGLILVLGGLFAGGWVLGDAFPTQNPLVAILALIASFVLAFGVILGAVFLILAAILWLIITPNKIKRLRALFRSIRTLLVDWRTYAVVAVIVAFGLIVALIPEPRHGLVTEWHEDGEKKSEANYVRGNKVTESIYVDGQPSLVTNWYRDSEIKDSEQAYVDGMLVRETEFHTNGHKLREVNYLNGQQEGPTFDYDDNGRPSLEIVYVAGQPTEQTQYDFFDNGQMKKSSRTRIKDPTQELYQLFWYESGQKKTEATIQRMAGGTGLRTDWYENGHKKSEYHYLDGKRHGLGTTWHDNGQKKSEANFVNNKQIGLETAWERDYTAAELAARRLVPRNSRSLEVPSDGLLGYFQFESNGEDSVYVRELTSSGTVRFGERLEGNQAANFKGWGYYTAESEPFQLKESLTIALWVKFTELPKRWGYGKLISNSTTGVELPPDRKFWSGYWIDVVPDVPASHPRHAQIMHPRFFAETNIGDSPEEKRNELTADRPIEIDVWSHIAVVFDGVQKAIYVNGKLSGTQYAAPNAQMTEITYASASEFLIGSWEQGEFSGELDDVLIYNRPLSEDEIRSVYLETRQ